MAKTIEESFIDWESTAFGYGYGSGDLHVLRALKGFFSLTGDDPDQPRNYDFTRLEALLSPPVAWLLINRLCQVDIIEYGSSPRYGWLTLEGEALKAFVNSRSAEQLADLVCSATEDTNICYPDACNCGPDGYEEGRVCINPFWRKRL